jgi:hypothetical protein
MYYAVKKGRKVPFSELDYEYFEHYLQRNRNIQNINMINAMKRELKLRDRNKKIEKLMNNVCKKR